MGNLVRAMTSDLQFGGFTTTPNPQYKTSKIYLCGYHHPNYFATLVPEMDLFSNILIIILQLVI